jgi:hypothetical protein
MGLAEPKFKRLRAMKMVEGKVLRNLNNAELAKEFHCSVDTVERTLTWAKRADIFATFEDKIVQELIPLAHDAIKSALAEGNAKIAVEVFKGLNLLRTGPAAAGSLAAAKEEDLAAYIAAKRDKAQLIEQTIDVTPRGEITDATTRTTADAAALPAAGHTGLPVDAEADPAPDGPGSGPEGL